MSIQAIAKHWNGASYSSDGEDWGEYDSLEDAEAAADELVGVYSTDAAGNPCDVDLQWEIYDGDDLIHEIIVKSAAGERAQDECEIVAWSERQYATDYIGVRDGALVGWTRNGGSRGAHDRWTNRGWQEQYETPVTLEPIEWLKRGLEYDATIEELIEAGDIDLSDLERDAQTDEAHWLDADGQCWTLPVYAIDLGGGKMLTWSDTDEAGIDDVEVISADDWPDRAEAIAEELGEVVDLESGEHYTTQGVQYQHQAEGDFDQDGFRIIIKRRD